ncbi:prephenate dehydrogenase [Candidatus Azobacteroides pseudotrichonymphae]|uniref:Prephenate dehydrogenase n=1 Tax=Azobacteroides pseudotrichonymphae genomovar. CFP2 TaxID=511995 RepID=B6YQG4_AZOPC|nr:prephenate dehydrogenase/arogenate dehydrogenase family protein [Candidatus Azobacteroides pseudotrichonymphae]BAG83436.1 prephenate dehydrogenase [Candidatus Azobacteroides pseudotrichonymphae genomovar. CFP2]
MKIQIVGAGKMGAFFADVLSFDHEVAIFDVDPERLRFTYNCIRISHIEEIAHFKPEILINAATVQYTVRAFEQILPYLTDSCIISDIASVKTGLKEFYENSGHPFVSTHPMFGPTFANLSNLSSENAIIISESGHLGKVFFRNLYNSLKLNICEYSFEEHDKTVAYSLSIPFASTLIFTSVMKRQEAPGTTFRKHMDIAHRLLSEDDYLLTEILFNPHTSKQLERIQKKLSFLFQIIENKDVQAMKTFLNEVRGRLNKESDS